MTSEGPRSDSMTRLALEYSFFIPLHKEAAALPPRSAVQLVDAPPEAGAGFVHDPTGAVTRFLTALPMPIKVIGVAGTFR